ncbi:3-methyladenine DNA glycosylase [Citricoccus muralis]|uniref:3-methyladenine DNA glycosylase n=1 Tax=Citricoccus muralis TaxID=169134 RepID=A0ABY8H8X0_9MICC|nr:3-methyladenine DNA glycosylase [Citricoccus muralis]WFP17057.1 3-methyladenine DNA glycosylase [Citricoccus muralis]
MAPTDVTALHAEHSTVLSAAQWQPRAEAHAERIGAFTDPLVALHDDGMKHPVYDFLFSYYSLSPAALKRWHPGPGVVVANRSQEEQAPHSQWKFYRRVEPDAAAGLPHGGWTVDVMRFREERASMIDFALRLLPATRERTARLSCFGLHEWAMAYRSDLHGIRHSTVPLRLGASGTDAVVEDHQISCSHFDAFRFYAPEARGFNQLQPTRASMVELEQPGCLHANMDLYKWCGKLLPLVDSELLAECFELAWEIRVMDMQASPYDLADWGFEPIRIETPEGKAEYVRAQRAFSERSQMLRERMIAALEVHGVSGG